MSTVTAWPTPRPRPHGSTCSSSAAAPPAVPSRVPVPVVGCAPGLSTPSPTGPSPPRTGAGPTSCHPACRVRSSQRAPAGGRWPTGPTTWAGSTWCSTCRPCGPTSTRASPTSPSTPPVPPGRSGRAGWPWTTDASSRHPSSSTRPVVGSRCAEAGSHARRPSRRHSASSCRPRQPRRWCRPARRSSWTGGQTTARAAGPLSSTASRSVRGRCCWRRRHSPAARAYQWRCCAAGSTHAWRTTASRFRPTPAARRCASRSTGRGTTSPASSGSVPPPRSCTRRRASASPRRWGWPDRWRMPSRPTSQPGRRPPWPRRARSCGRARPGQCTGSAGSGLRRCCGCRRRRCRGSSTSSSTCPSASAGPTSPAATTCPARSPRWGPVRGVGVAAAPAARRAGGAACAARQRRAGRAVVTYTPVSRLRTLPSGSSNHALLKSS